MDTYRSGQPSDGIDEESSYVPGATLSDPNRRHVTLDNLADLADYGAPATPPLLAPEPGLDAVEAPAPIRSAWAQPAERWLLEFLSLAGAAIAFVAPTIWLLIVAVGCVVGGVAAFVVSGNLARSLPRRVIWRAVALLHPRSSLWAPVIFARTVLAAVILPGGIAAVVWLVEEGSSGAVAAARAGAWTYGFRTAAALVCFMLLASVGDGRYRRGAGVRRWASPATDGTVVLLAISCCAAAALAIGAAPHPTDAIASRADGLGWLPPGARAEADRVRDDIVTNELDSLASCLSSRDGTKWRPSYSAENEFWEADVARLQAFPEGGDEPADALATVLLAAHNQLAPWVETVEVELPGGDVIGVDRTQLPHDQPLTDTAVLAAAASAGRQTLADSSADTTVVLRCSAGPVL